MAKKSYSIGLDFGTNSVRTLIVNVRTGEEVGTAVFNYPTGDAGVVIDSRDPNLARQHPADYIVGIEASVKKALRAAAKASDSKVAENVVGIGVDTTGSTPLPVDDSGTPLALRKEFKRNPAAMAWLWKDHTGHAEAAEITQKARETRPQFLAKCGGVYSSEWWWSKILKCRRSAPKVFDAATTWVEIADWIPAHLTGSEKPERIKRGICAAGHKAMFHASWGGYPDAEFLASLDPALARVRKALPNVAYTVDEPMGGLTEAWAARLGIKPGIPVAVGAFDAHLGAVGSGIKPGTLVKIIGTSTCDMMVAPETQALADVPGICGIVPGSILPKHFGLEAGQSAVGDIFNWFVRVVNPKARGASGHAELTKEAEKAKPGASGLLALDWNNGNRTILVDQRLTGLLLGQTLHTTPAEIYRALVEATAYGARVIMERFEEYGVAVKEVINCGGIAEKNPMVMQIYADVTGRPMKLSRSAQTCALGAAMAGAVCAGAHEDFAAASAAMTGQKKTVYRPKSKNVAVYNDLFTLYKDLHDAFGTSAWRGNLAHVMKRLLDIRDRTR